MAPLCSAKIRRTQAIQTPKIIGETVESLHIGEGRMLKWIFAKGFAGITVLAAGAIAVGYKTDYVSLPQLCAALAGFLGLGLVTLLLNAKPRSVGKTNAQPHADLQQAEAIYAKVKAGSAIPEDFETLTPIAKKYGLPIPLGFDPHEGASVVLVRHRRDPGFDVTRDGTSWFGGLPALGGADWPNAKTGRPMTPLAQIDLATAAPGISIPGLPTTGSLAFFVNTSEGPLEGAVRYISGLETQPTPPPAGLYLFHPGRLH